MPNKQPKLDEREQRVSIFDNDNYDDFDVYFILGDENANKIENKYKAELILSEQKFIEGEICKLEEALSVLKVRLKKKKRELKKYY